MRKDVVEKRLEDYEDVFADVFNALLFEGKEVLKPEDLETIPTEGYSRGEDGQWRQRWRDVVKKDVKNHVVLGIFGIENQTQRDNTMPVRVMGYDYAAYTRQITDVVKENEKNGCPAYLKQIHDGQRLVPVVTLVLSFDRSGWKYPLALKDMLEIPEGAGQELMPYIQDYKINLVDLSSLSDTVMNRLQSDFRFVAEFMVAKSDKEKLKRLMADSSRKIKHPMEFLDMMEAITSDRRFRKIKQQVLQCEDKEEVAMCTLLDEIMNEGIEQGIEQGVERGEQEKTKVFVRNLINRGMSDEEICALAECSQEIVAEVHKGMR